MKTDRELLEAAAKAAGISGEYVETIGGYPAIKRHEYDYTPWCPLHYDGDEARLEAALGLDVTWYDEAVEVSRQGSCGYIERFEKHKGDKQAARCRAGVRAAAAIGEAP